MHPGCCVRADHLKERPVDHLKERPVVSQSKLRKNSFGTLMQCGADWLTVSRYGDSTLVYIPSHWSQDASY